MLICPHCSKQNENTSVYCASCGQPLVKKELQSRQNPELVTLTPEGEIIVEVHSVAEAKLALKELKMRKKQFNLQKKQVNEQMRQIRADYTEQNRNRMMTMRGGGTLGKIVRTAQAFDRQADRQNLAAALAPLEHQKRWYESVILTVDKAILKIELALSQSR